MTPIVIRNPGDLDQTVCAFSPADVSQAIGAMSQAVESFRVWRRFPVAERLRILERAIVLLEERTEIFRQAITSENGKTLEESDKEIASTLKDARHQLKVMKDFEWESVVETPDSSVRSSIRREPVGAFLLITPWNFPLATILRKLVPAIGFGNTVVCKPAEVTPLSAFHLFEILDEAGFPPGVANLVLGRGSEIGPALIDHPRLAGISFTGSTEVGLRICHQVADHQVRLQMEMGGKNALVVLEDADLVEAVEATALAAFSCAGQWCTSTSRVLVERSVMKDFLDLLQTRISQIHVGNGSDPETTMGPVISKCQRREDLEAVAKALEEGATLLMGGEAKDVIDGKRGWYMEPTVFIDVSPESTLAREEVFGPVLAVVPVDSPEEALAVANRTRFGLSFSVYTQSKKWADRFVEEVESAVCHVNLRPLSRRRTPDRRMARIWTGVPECPAMSKGIFMRGSKPFTGERIENRFHRASHRSDPFHDTQRGGQFLRDDRLSRGGRIGSLSGWPSSSRVRVHLERALFGGRHPRGTDDSSIDEGRAIRLNRRDGQKLRPIPSMGLHDAEREAGRTWRALGRGRRDRHGAVGFGRENRGPTSLPGSRRSFP